MANCLGSASRASGGVTSLRVGSTSFGQGTLLHHDGEGSLTTEGIKVSRFTRVNSRGVGAVSIPGLEGVEVKDSTRGARVPFVVNDRLGGGVPHLSVELSVITEELHGSAHTEGGGGKGRSRGRKGEKSDDLGVLWIVKKKKKCV